MAGTLGVCAPFLPLSHSSSSPSCRAGSIRLPFSTASLRLLAITLRFRHDLGGEMLSGEVASLVRQMLARFDPASLLGFRNMEFEEHEIEQPGLLDGAPGGALALLAAATPMAPTWDRLFLLSLKLL